MRAQISKVMRDPSDQVRTVANQAWVRSRPAAAPVVTIFARQVNQAAIETVIARPMPNSPVSQAFKVISLTAISALP